MSLGVGTVNTAILALAFRLKRNVVPYVKQLDKPRGQQPRERVDTIEEVAASTPPSGGADTAPPQKNDGVLKALRD